MDHNLEEKMLNYNIQEWSHAFKLDPAKEIDDEQLALLCESGTDAIIVGGTDNVTFEGVLDLLSRIRRYTVPCLLEVSEMDAISPGFDFYFIPMVLNSKDKKWAMDIQHKAIKQYKSLIDLDQTKFEAYCIMNPESKAFQKTDCKMPDKADVLTFAFMAEHIFNLPIFYMEYSGIYGDVDLLKKVKNELQHTVLFYGGGIQTKEQAIEMKQHADVVIVGNSIYTDFASALETADIAKK